MGEADYQGYYRRDMAEPDSELTRVGPEMPCGEWLRRSWQPIAMSSELGDIPLALRVLGEDLVLFRDRSGRLGLLHRHCAHRGASLEYGIIMERGISCCYHGWHYDVDGRILDTPAEPPTSKIKNYLTQGAYPLHEEAGLIFAYLGPPALRPDFPIFDTMRREATKLVPFWLEMPCNWLQIYENSQDPVHVVYLHTRMSGPQFGEASGVEQVLGYRDTPLGMANIQTRLLQGHIWTRMVEAILPNGNQTGAIWESANQVKLLQQSSLLRWTVPIDDTHSAILGWRFFSDQLDPLKEGDESRVGRQTIDFIGQTEDRPYHERQRRPGDYDVQISQRPVAIHRLEHLASSDRGVSRLRRMIRAGIRATEQETTPRNFLPRPGDGLVPTFTHDTVWKASQSVDPDNQNAIAQIGDRIASCIIDHAHLPHHERVEHLHSTLSSL